MSTPTPARVRATPGALFGLAWPIIISRASQSVVGLTDAYMVTHLGATALAATTTGAMNAFTLFILPMGTVFIIGSFASQLFGRGDMRGARRFALYGLLLGLVTELLALLVLPLLGAAVGAFPYAPALAAHIEEYLAIRLLSSGAVVGIEALGAYYGGLGNTRLPMRVNLLAMVLNVAGNALLIDGRLGLPALGVRGAALASTLATVGALLFFLGCFIAHGRSLGAVFPRLVGGELRSVLRFGLPAGFNWFFEFAAFMFFVNVVIAGLGTTHLAALMAVLNLNSVAFMPSFALASAGAIVVGQAIGAQQQEDVPRAVRLTFLMAGGWQALIGLLYLTIPSLIFEAFFARGASSDVQLLRVGTRMLMLSAAWQLFDAAAATLAEALRAAGDTTFTLWARIVLAWAVFAPGAYLSVHVWGAGDVVAMLWVVLYLGALAGILWWRFDRGAWRTLDLAGTVQPAL